MRKWFHIKFFSSFLHLPSLLSPSLCLSHVFFSHLHFNIYESTISNIKKVKKSILVVIFFLYSLLLPFILLQSTLQIFFLISKILWCPVGDEIHFARLLWLKDFNQWDLNLDLFTLTDNKNFENFNKKIFILKKPLDLIDCMMQIRIFMILLSALSQNTLILYKYSELSLNKQI